MTSQQFEKLQEWQMESIGRAYQIETKYDFFTKQLKELITVTDSDIPGSSFEFISPNDIDHIHNILCVKAIQREQSILDNIEILKNKIKVAV